MLREIPYPRRPSARVSSSWQPAAQREACDLNGDGVTDLTDLFAVVACFGQSVAQNPSCANADVIVDGTVNILDVSLCASEF